MNTQQHQRIDLVNIEDEMQRAYIDYSMSVIIGRALPDARDGLKPGNRRILFAMKERGWVSSKPFVKCAKIVGEVIGNYHPHGDTAVYDTMVRMAQDFSMRCMLINGQGNFGSIDGDRAAAYRYTECKLLPLAEEMLADIDKNTVDMRPNFDETLMEPTVLPARIPNLLINGSTGIAVGMATNIPPHNLSEVIDGTIHLIENPNASAEDLCHFIKGPDFPTAGIVHGLGGIRSMYLTGRGRIRMRGKADIEEFGNNRERIIITEIPYAVNKASMITRMAELVREKNLEGISDIRDESGKLGIRVVIELKKGAIGKVVLNNIYKHTQLASTFGAIMLAIDGNRPRIMNLKELLQCFIKHRFQVITRRTQFDLDKNRARAHILEGLLIALDNLDEVVRIIRASKSREEAQTKLIERFQFSELQVKAILDMRLYQLTGLERDKIQAEYDELQKQIAYLIDLLEHEEKLYGVIKDDLAEIKAKYGEPRRTQLEIDEGEIDIEDLIADEPCAITLSNTGYIKRVPVDTYRQQRRGGKGVMGMDTKDEDFVEHVFTASTHDYLLCFTQAGRMYWLKAYHVPEGSRTARGRALANVIEMGPDEKLAAILCVRELDDENHCLFMATKNGTIKKTVLSAYKNVRAGGINAIGIDEGDRLIGVQLTNGNDEIILSMKNGKAIRFKESIQKPELNEAGNPVLDENGKQVMREYSVRPMGRTAGGVRGVTLEGDDQVVSIEIVNTAATMMAITENGYGKRTNFDEYRLQSRGGKGIISIQTTERNGNVVSAHAVTGENRIMLISQNGQMICIGASDLRVIGRNTQGVRLVNLNEGDKIVSAAVLDPEAEVVETVAPVSTEVVEADIPESDAE